MVTDLEVAKLCELFATVIQSAGKRLCLLVGDFVRANIAALSKFLVANFARIRFLSSVASFMSLSRSNEKEYQVSNSYSSPAQGDRVLGTSKTYP